MIYHQRICVLCLRERLGKLSAIVIAAEAFDWTPQKAREILDGLDNSLLLDNEILSKVYGRLFVQTEFRIQRVTEEFLQSCEPERAKTILEAVERLNMPQDW